MTTDFRYLGNTLSGVYHDRHALNERCNTDAIEERRDFAEEPTGHEGLESVPWLNWRLCGWCRRQRERERRDG